MTYAVCIRSSTPCIPASRRPAFYGVAGFLMRPEHSETKAKTETRECETETETDRDQKTVMRPRPKTTKPRPRPRPVQSSQ